MAPPTPASPALAWTRTALVAVLGFVGGTVFGDLLAFRNDVLAPARESISEYAVASDQLSQLIRSFVDQANGISMVTEAEERQFRTLLQDQFNAAQLVASHIPEIQTEFAEHAEAIVTFQEAALSLQGPAESRNFIEALSEYEATKIVFRDAAITETQNYLRSFAVAFR